MHGGTVTFQDNHKNKISHTTKIEYPNPPTSSRRHAALKTNGEGQLNGFGVSH